MSLVTRVFEDNVKFASALANVKDPNGRSAISIAHVDIQTIMWKYILFLGISHRSNITIYK